MNLQYNYPDDNKPITDLLKEIKRHGFEYGTQKFLNINNEWESQLSNTQYDKSVDTIFHGIGDKYNRCLDITGKLGNKAEILSHICC